MLLEGVCVGDGVPHLHLAGWRHLPDAHLLTLSLPPGIGLPAGEQAQSCLRVTRGCV